MYDRPGGIPTDVTLHNEFTSALADLQAPAAVLVNGLDRVVDLFYRAAALEALPASERDALVRYAESMRVLRDMLRDTERLAILMQAFGDVYREALSVGPDETRH